MSRDRDGSVFVCLSMHTKLGGQTYFTYKRISIFVIVLAVAVLVFVLVIRVWMGDVFLGTTSRNGWNSKQCFSHGIWKLLSQQAEVLAGWIFVCQGTSLSFFALFNEHLLWFGASAHESSSSNHNWNGVPGSLVSGSFHFKVFQRPHWWAIRYRKCLCCDIPVSWLVHGPLPWRWSSQCFVPACTTGTNRPFWSS